MDRCLAFALGGGGSRGALQVGALRALFEAGFIPDLVVGTSIGALNAAILGVRGANLEAVAALERLFADAAGADLMDSRIPHLAAQVLSGRPNVRGSQRMAEYYIAQGVPPDLRFGQVTAPRVGLIGADLDTAEPVIYGRDPEGRLLDGLMASTALPPWFAPIKKDGHVIMDGGVVSLVPVEPALSLGATEVFALALDDPKPPLVDHPDLYHFIDKVSFAASRRELRLEIALAEARGVPVRWIGLRCPRPTIVSDFSRWAELIDAGFAQTKQQIADWAGGTRSDG